MKHLGDITKIKGCTAPVVDCIIGGSPCQDLSLAGKRAGLAGARSGLYMEQIRICKEMRHEDELRGRTGESIRPRYMVWENVPGAFSTNQGQDFAAVLEEAIRVAEPEAPDVPVPEKGWPTCGCIMGERWSVAWRVLDAQFWGTSDKPLPQRRRRIALVADFGGRSAPEILFVRQSVSGDLEPGEPKRKETAGDVGEGTGGASNECVVFNGSNITSPINKTDPKPGDPCHTLTGDNRNLLLMPALALQGSMIGRADHNGPQGDGINEDVSFTLNTTDRHAVVYGISPYHSNCMKSDNPHSGYYEADTARTLDALQCGYPGCNQGGMAVVQSVVDSHILDDQGGSQIAVRNDGKSPTLRAEMHGNLPCVLEAYSIENHPADSRVDIDESGKAQTLTSRMGTGGGNVPMVMVPKGYEMQAFGKYTDSGIASSLKVRDFKDATDLVVAAVDCRNATELPEQNFTLQSSCCHNLNSGNVVRVKHIVRRLTPLECERLQGFPSDLKLDVSKMTKDEYIAWNIYKGNIIVDAEKGKVYRTRGPGGVKLDKPQEMKGSDCNGYLVVKISNGTTKLMCRIHRIVWISQYGIVPEGYCIDHINSDKKDNRISNLQILTPAENSTKAANDGLYATGEDNVATKVSPDLWDEIAYLHHVEGHTMRQLAEMYGISKSRVQQIAKEVGWTDIGEWVDSKGKKHKEADSPRYKALGNSIAIPPWKWVLKRLCACYERDATMASLFDGIGGFPYIWEQLNGKGSCLWASEIEEFPIAVTKLRFGGNENG